ncbi:hypothetical protein MAJ_05063, partial [Metarhizium majus ARSEF 297]
MPVSPYAAEAWTENTRLPQRPPRTQSPHTHRRREAQYCDWGQVHVGRLVHLRLSDLGTKGLHALPLRKVNPGPQAAVHGQDHGRSLRRSICLPHCRHRVALHAHPKKVADSPISRRCLCSGHAHALRVIRHKRQHRLDDFSCSVIAALEGPNAVKLLCGIWLCTGGFVVVAAVFRCIICLLNNKKANIALIWSLRETFVGIIATNIPIVGPWIARAVHNLRGIHSGGRSKTSDAGGLSDPPGGHRLSRLERRAKENRIRRGLGWTTIRSGSHDYIAKEELELQSKSPSQSDWSGITVSGTGSSGLVH